MIDRLQALPPGDAAAGGVAVPSNVDVTINQLDLID
jgi:hypothetical protein